MSFERRLWPTGRKTTRKEAYGSATVATGSGIRGRDAGKARAHDHQTSKEISTRQSLQIRKRRDLVREVLSRSRRSTKTCSARPKFRDQRDASTHRAGRHHCCIEQEPCANAGGRTCTKVR